MQMGFLFRPQNVGLGDGSGSYFVNAVSCKEQGGSHFGLLDNDSRVSSRAIGLSWGISLGTAEVGYCAHVVITSWFSRIARALA